jgi:hypothetical protein
MRGGKGQDQNIALPTELLRQVNYKHLTPDGVKPTVLEPKAPKTFRGEIP